MNAAIEMHKSNKQNVSSRNVRRKKNYYVKFNLGLFFRQNFTWYKSTWSFVYFRKNNVWFMSGVQAFAKIALSCDKYRENGINPESGIDLRLVLKRYFHSGRQNICGP